MEGTIPTVASSTIQEQSCEDGTFLVPVTSIEGDTIESLFALYPDPEISLIDRLSAFYLANPHLKLQGIIAGEKVLLPLSNLNEDKCPETVL